MNKRTIIILIFLAISGLFYLLVYSVLIPKTATLSVPFKWRSIPVKQSKTLVHAYLGGPAKTDSANGSSKETWFQGAKGRMYQLQIDFADSVAMRYSIRFLFKNNLFARNYLIDSVGTP